MKMKKLALVSFVCSSLLAIASNVHAQATDETPPVGAFHAAPYVQGSFGVQQSSSPSATGTAMNLNGSTTSAATSMRGTVGLQLNKYIGLEGTWFQLPSTSVATSVGGAVYKGEAFVASITGSLPLHMDFDLVGRLGLGLSDVNVTVPATTYSSNSRQNLAVWGLGARFNINPSTDLTFDYDNLGAVGKYTQGGSVMVEMLSIGVRFKF
jgi:hypothetical protein